MALSLVRPDLARGIGPRRKFDEMAQDAGRDGNFTRASNSLFERYSLADQSARSSALIAITLRNKSRKNNNCSVKLFRMYYFYFLICVRVKASLRKK